MVPRLGKSASVNDTITNFGFPDTLVKEYDHWVVLCRPQQVTLGSLVLAAKSNATAFHDLPTQAFTELGTVINDIETTLSPWLKYDKINYLMLMMVDPHVHYHVLPRYEGHRAFSNTNFDDAGWPGPPNLGAITETTAAQLAELTAELKRLWPAGN